MSSRYIRSETRVSMAINTVISGLFAWFPFQGVSTVPLWGGMGMVVDLLPTVFMITLMTANIETLLTRKRVRSGELAAMPVPPRWQWLPRNVLLRALVLGLLMTALLVPLMTALFLVTGIESLPYPVFFAYKLVFGALLALLITPIILRRALGDQQQ